jgi:DNA-directed RNA polymerase alpha subunit
MVKQYEAFEGFRNIGITARISNILLENQIDTIQKLKEIEFRDLLKIPGIGLISANIIHNSIKKHVK